MHFENMMNFCLTMLNKSQKTKCLFTNIKTSIRKSMLTPRTITTTIKGFYYTFEFYENGEIHTIYNYTKNKWQFEWDQCLNNKLYGINFYVI